MKKSYHKIVYITGFLLSILLPTFQMNAKKDKEDISVDNQYGEEISIQAKWRMRDKPHTTRMQDIQSIKGHVDNYKAPISGYDLEYMILTPTAVAAAFGLTALGPGVASGMVAFQTTIHPNTNRYFVVKIGEMVKSTKTPKITISAYADKAAYEASKNTTPALSDTTPANWTAAIIAFGGTTAIQAQDKTATPVMPADTTIVSGNAAYPDAQVILQYLSTAGITNPTDTQNLNAAFTANPSIVTAS